MDQWELKKANRRLQYLKTFIDERQNEINDYIKKENELNEIIQLTLEEIDILKKAMEL